LADRQEGRVSIAGTGNGDDVPPTADPSIPATVRPGPAQLPADSWDAPAVLPAPGGWSSSGPWIPTGPRKVAGDYPGHRRADPSRRWVPIIGLVLLALVAVVVVPLLWSGSGSGTDPQSDGGRSRAGAPAAPSGDVAGTQGQPGGDVSLAPATGAAGATTAPATTAAPAVVVPPPDPSPVRPTTAPTVSPVTYEAEGPNVTIAGSAFVDAYPGASKGSIVRNLGRWDNNPGTLRFNTVAIPVAGTYVLTFYAVHLDGEPTRSAQITVSGANTVTVTFTANATCCTPVRVTIVLAAGNHTVTVANPAGHAPSLDKLVVSRQ